MNKTVSFIGAGNMARSIISGLIHRGKSPRTIYASAPTKNNLVPLQIEYGINITQDNAAATEKADILVLAVKPQKMREVCTPLRDSISPHTSIISLAAGISCESLQDWLGGECALIRCMPNTPSQIGLGACGMYAHSAATEQQKKDAEQLMGSVALVEWVSDESLIDAVTAVSGSGPAYFFLMLEAMTEAGIAQGLPAHTARNLAIQTARGAAELARQSSKDLNKLRLDVTSPGGTTAEAISSFEKQGFRQIVNSAMAACSNRAKELAELLSKP